MLSIDVGVKHLAHCWMEGLTIVHWDVTDLTIQPCDTCQEPAVRMNGSLRCCQAHCVKKGSVMKHTMTTMAEQLKRAYDAMNTPTHVIVENQLGPLASTMKGVQGMVVQYWVCRGAPVTTVSPTQKLKLFQLGETTYAQRKKESIKWTRLLLNAHHMPTDVFEAHHKKDDLADAFLQLVAFAVRTEPLFHQFIECVRT